MTTGDNDGARPLVGVENWGDMGWLPTPWQYVEPRVGEPFTLKIVRYQVGLSQRSVDVPPGYIIRPTIRLFLASDGDAPADYVDFTNRGLADQVTQIYDNLVKRALGDGQQFDARLTLAVFPEAEEALTFRFTRVGTGIDTRYTVELMEDAP